MPQQLDGAVDAHVHVALAPSMLVPKTAEPVLAAQCPVAESFSGCPPFLSCPARRDGHATLRAEAHQAGGGGRHRHVQPHRRRQAEASAMCLDRPCLRLVPTERQVHAATDGREERSGGCQVMRDEHLVAPRVRLHVAQVGEAEVRVVKDDVVLVAERRLGPLESCRVDAVPNADSTLA